MKPDVVKLEGPAAEVLSAWQAVDQQNGAIEARATRFLYLGAFLFLILLVLESYLRDRIPPVLAYSAWVLLAGTVGCLWLERKTKKQLLDHAKLLTARLLVELLEDDELPTEGPIRLKVDFRDYAAEEFQTASRGDRQPQAARQKTLLESMDSPIGGVWTEPDRIAFRQTWFEFQGSLGDGATFDLEVLRHAERQVHSKTTGRIGLPFEDEVHEEITLVLRVPGGNPGDLLSHLAPELPDGLTSQGPQVEGDTIRMELFTPAVRRDDTKDLGLSDLTRPADLVGLLLQANQKIQQSRR